MLNNEDLPSLAENYLEIPQKVYADKSESIVPQSILLNINEEENYFYRILELEQEKKFLTSFFQRQRLKDIEKFPERQSLWDHDWLEIEILEWKYRINNVETQFHNFKKAHSNLVDAQLEVRYNSPDKKESSDLRELLRNRNNDVYEIMCLIKELKKVAWELLPSKLGKYCEEMDIQLDNMKLKFDEKQMSCHKYKMTMAKVKKDISSINASIEKKRNITEVYKMRINTSNQIKDNWNKRLWKIIQKVKESEDLLTSFGFPMSDILKIKNKRETSKKYQIKETNEDLEDVSEALKKDKIKFLEEKIENLDKEIIITKAEIEKYKKENIISSEIRTIYKNIKEEIQNLLETKNEVTIHLHQEIILRKTYYNEIEDLKGKVRVFCRCRPINKVESERHNFICVSFPDIYTVAVTGVIKEKNVKEFQFDKVFTMGSSQLEVFLDTAKLIQSAFDGFNVCIFAYGQTGSGKTHTLIGNFETNPGIVPRVFQKIFEIIDEGKIKFKTELKCYMLELYNEKLLDLMTSGAEYSDKLEIKKDPNGMVIVPGAELLPASSIKDLTELFKKGNNNRHIASTKMNSESSRSHLILSIMITCKMLVTPKTIYGKMSIIDLAGSERLVKSGVKGMAAQEAMSINMSLSSLGDVISALTSGNSFIPYRNNKLTMLMQDSLGGNAKTLMFVTISPVDYNGIETISSLTYATRVKLIKNDPLKVPDSEEIEKLQRIIKRLLNGERGII